MMTATREFHTRAIRLWLYAVAALVLAMVLVGGATRLTESGLSITEWKPVMGTLPPLGESGWQAEFEKYRAIPQYRELNAGMSLAQFKTIYWWEWAHRLLGRLIGVAFLLPFLWFLWRGWVAPALRAPLWFIFGLGALQGGVGWWMVASGLADRVEVSQYRLATHLVLACVIYVALIWTAQRLRRAAGFAGAARGRGSGRGAPALHRHRSPRSLVGANVSRRAGRRIARRLCLQHLAADRRRIGAARVGAVLRYAAVAEFFRECADRAVRPPHARLCDLYLGAVARARRRAHGRRAGPARAGAFVLAASVVLQVALGVATLLLQVPLAVALAHQGLAMLVLTAAAVHAANVVGTRIRHAGSAPTASLAMTG